MTWFRAAVAAALLVPASQIWAAPAFNDPRDTPARISRLAEAGPQTAVALAGERFVAVGPRGQILVADVGREGWRQVPSPVSVDLTAVTFATPLQGWAVGHDAVVLHTADGGNTWVKQLDGRQVARSMLNFYKRGDVSGTTAATTAAALAEANRLMQIDGGSPLLSVWFRDPQNGFVVGSFNLILHTGDGGASWEPWFHRTENPRLSSLYAVTGDANDVFVAGEQGLLMKLDAAAERFRLVKPPYEGSFFGAVIPRPGTLVAFGMRGNVWATADGAATWRRVSADESAGVTAGAVLADGRFVVATQSGRLLTGLMGTNGPELLRPLAVARPTAYSGIAASAQGLLGTTGWAGVALERLSPP